MCLGIVILAVILSIHKKSKMSIKGGSTGLRGPYQGDHIVIYVALVSFWIDLNEWHKPIQFMKCLYLIYVYDIKLHILSI